MSSILNVLRSAPTPTRHFTSLQIVSSARSSQAAAASATGFNPEHHPIVLQQLVESLSPSSFVSSVSTSEVKMVQESLSGKTLLTKTTAVVVETTKVVEPQRQAAAAGHA